MPPVDNPADRFPAWAVALLGFLLLVIGPAARAGAAGPPIRIGATVSLQGRFQEPSAMVHDGYRLWVAQANRRGGLLGRPVELVVYDDLSLEERTRELYRRLLDVDRVDLLLSPYGSPLTMAAAGISDPRGFVLVASAAAAEAVWEQGYRHLFGVYATAPRYFVGLLDLMARQGHRSIALLHEDNPFNTGIAEGVIWWAPRFRIQVALHRTIDGGGTDLDAAVSALQGLDPAPDGLIVAAYPELGYRLLERLQATGKRPRVLALTIAPSHPDFAARLGPGAEGVFAPSQWEPDERIAFPGTRDFIAAFREFTGRMPSYHAGSAYAACQVLERAVTQTASLDHARLREYIARLDTVTVIGRFKVDGRGMQVGHNPILIQWQAGRKEIVYPTKMQTAAPRFQAP
jgi:branched-chain amino acid transport system substrate-binding protein